MSVSVEIIGLDKLKKRLEKISTEAEQQVGNALNDGAMLIRNTAVQNIQQGTHSGETYKRGNIEHQASAPGEYPATDTGMLVSSIHIEVGKEGKDVVAQVGSPLDYATYLEFGTTKMAARPFLQPSFELNKAKIKDLVNAVMKSLIRKK